jgi:hypothetical protein
MFTIGRRVDHAVVGDEENRRVPSAMAREIQDDLA